MNFLPSESELADEYRRKRFDEAARTHTPYPVTIRQHREGQPLDPINHTDAEEAANILTEYSDLTEVIDPEHSIWHVWLPDRMVGHVWDTGITFHLIVGGYEFNLEMDPA